MVDGREATAITVVPWSSARRFASTRASVVGSSAEVVSSRRSARGRPHERTRQRDPLALPTGEADTTLADDRLDPLGEIVHERASAAASAEAIASSEHGRPSVTFSRTEPARRNGSWNTSASSPRGTVIVPADVGIRPPITWSIVVLPAPVAPDDGHGATGRARAR